MKYHKIRKVPLEVCTAEQKIAYNIAFSAHINFQEKYDAARKISEVCRIDVINQILNCEMENYERTYCDGKQSRYDIDAIFSALRSGIDEYLKKPFIATDYKSIGKSFPANYL